MKIDKIIEAFKTLYALIPNWRDAEHKRFTVLLARDAWIEYNPANKTLKIKVAECPRCGDCCMTLRPDSDGSIFGVDGEGKCKKLYVNGKEWLCGANHDTPYRCLVIADEANCPEYNAIIREVKIG